MNCKVCNLELSRQERGLPNTPGWWPEETWAVDRDNWSNESNKYIIRVGYDSGYAELTIHGIEYCPKCGRRLGGVNDLGLLFGGEE